MFAQACRVPPVLAPIALAACVALGPVSDPEVAALARAIDADSLRFHAALAQLPAPQCGYEQNRAFYDGLQARAEDLRGRIALHHKAAPAMRAGNALVRLAAQLRASHQAASAKLDDRHGPCLAPDAIALNADALTRAAKAIAMATSAKGDE